MKRSVLFFAAVLLCALALLGCAAPNKQQRARLDAYGIELTREQLAGMDLDAFLHDLDCLFGEGQMDELYAEPVASADCERYEGKGYACQRWLGGEYTMKEMLVGGTPVYWEEYDFPMTEDDPLPTDIIPAWED